MTAPSHIPGFVRNEVFDRVWKELDRTRRRLALARRSLRQISKLPPRLVDADVAKVAARVVDKLDDRKRRKP